MKIVQINSHYNQGGAARIVTWIHRYFLEEKEEIESYVAYGRGERTTDENVYRFNHVWEIYLSALLSRLTGINGWFNRRATKRLIQYLEKIEPDVLHMHALHGYYLNWPLLFAYINKHNIPVVWTFHDCHAFVGNCGYFFDCTRWQEGCGNCPYIQNYPKSQFFDFTGWMWKRKKQLFTQTDNKIIVTPSEWLGTEVRKSFLGKYPCVTINNGVDCTQNFYPRNKKECREKYGYKEEKIVLGIAVGYKDPRKGAQYMVNLAKEIKDAKVILIGWENMNQDLLKGITNVDTLPAIADENILAEYYSLADVFVLTSLAENYATVSLEAMACGTPVVGFDSGGTPEQMAGEKGVVVPTKDQEALIQAVRDVLNGEIKLLQGESLAKQIKEKNSLMKMTEEYRAIYKQVMKRKMQDSGKVS